MATAEVTNKVHNTINQIFSGDLPCNTDLNWPVNTKHKIHHCWLDWENNQIDGRAIEEIAANLSNYQQRNFLSKLYFRLSYFFKTGKSIHRHYEALILFRLVDKLPALPMLESLHEAAQPKLPAELKKSCQQLGWFSKMKKLMRELTTYFSNSDLITLFDLSRAEAVAKVSNQHVATCSAIVTTTYETTQESNATFENITANDFLQQIRTLKKFAVHKKTEAYSIRLSERESWVQEQYKEFNREFKRLALQIHPDKQDTHGLSSLESHQLMIKLNAAKLSILDELKEVCQTANFEALLAQIKQQTEALAQEEARIKQKIKQIKKELAQKDKILAQAKKDNAKASKALAKASEAAAKASEAAAKASEAAARKDARIAELERQLAQSQNPQGLFHQPASSNDEPQQPQHKSTCVLM